MINGKNPLIVIFFCKKVTNKPILASREYNILQFESKTRIINPIIR